MRVSFWRRLVFESVDQVERAALPEVVEPHLSAEGLNRTKWLTLLRGGENSSC